MIMRGSLKPEAFITLISSTIARDYDPHRPDDLTFTALDHGDKSIYLGSGYWRALPIWSEDNDPIMLGVRLINPDRTPADIATVEHAIAILGRLEYRQ